VNTYKNDFASMSKSRFDDNDAVAYWCIFMPTFLLGTNVPCNQLLKSVTNKRRALSELTTQNLIPDANFWLSRTKRTIFDRSEAEEWIKSTYHITIKYLYLSLVELFHHFIHLLDNNKVLIITTSILKIKIPSFHSHYGNELRC